MVRVVVAMGRYSNLSVNPASVSPLDHRVAGPGEDPRDLLHQITVGLLDALRDLIPGSEVLIEFIAGVPG